MKYLHENNKNVIMYDFDRLQNVNTCYGNIKVLSVRVFCNIL